MRVRRTTWRYDTGCMVIAVLLPILAMLLILWRFG